jgi:cell division protein FtsB
MAETKDTTGERKEQGSDKQQTASNPKTDAAKAAEKTVWEKAAETIAGDNKLMEGVLKVVLSPIALLGGLGLLVYCFFEMRKQKEQIDKLQSENKELSDDNKEIKEKYKKWKIVAKELEAEKNAVPNIGYVQQKVLPMQNTMPVKKTYQSDYLD